MKCALCCLALLGYQLSLAHGQDPGADNNARIADRIAKNVAVIVEYIAVEHTDVTRLLRAHRHEGTDTRLREDVGKLIEAGQAELAEITQLVTRSGSQAETESVVEITYPTARDPAEMPAKVEGPIEDISALITPATPTAFQTRNIGLMVKATPQLGPSGDIIDINFLSEVVKHEGDAVVGQRQAQVKHPQFYTMRVSTILSAPVGESMLAAVHTPSEEFQALKEGKSLDSEKRLLVFVRALALPSTTPAQLRELLQNK